MSALVMNEPLQMPSGVAVSNAGEPLQLVCDTGLRVIRGKRETNGPVVAQTIGTMCLDSMMGPGSFRRQQGYRILVSMI